MRGAKRLCWIAVLVGASSCNLYFQDDDDDCKYGAQPVDQGGYRNPETGLCEFTGGGGGGGGSCDPVPLSEAAGALPDWGMCISQCTGLDELSCQATSGCQAAYVSSCSPNSGIPCDVDAFYVYAECWAVSPSGPVQGGDCSLLDAYECSRHDDCVKRHAAALNCNGEDCLAPPEAADQAIVAPTFGPFQSCAAESNNNQFCYDSLECGSGYECNFDTCYADPNTCGGGAPGDSAGGAAAPCACAGICVPTSQPTQLCFEEVWCRSLPPECAAGTYPGVSNHCWTGECVPAELCLEGSCVGDVVCDAIPPTCPADQIPGWRNGCFTGYCIPEDVCNVSTEACDLLSESECIERNDCSPLYQGLDCSCNGDSCNCSDWQFQSCQSGSPEEWPCDCAGDVCECPVKL